MEKNKLETSLLLHPLFHIDNQFFMYRFLTVPGCPALFLVWDMMKHLGVTLVMGHLPGLLMLQKGLKMVYIIPLEVYQQVSPSALYNGIPGRAETAICVKIQLTDPNHHPSCRQYPLKQEAKEGLQPIIKKFLEHRLLKPCQSPCNIPILPVVKPTVEYRMVQDLRLVNNAVIPIHPLVADPYTILSQIPEDSKWFTVLDLKDAFFTIPLH
jgi:hypothetical protein